MLLVSICEDAQLAKNEFGNHYLLLLVHFDGDTLAVVEDRNLIVLAVNVDLDGIHGWVVDLGLSASTAFSSDHAPTLLSAALTKISSKILKKPGTKVVCLLLSESVKGKFQL